MEGTDSWCRTEHSTDRTFEKGGRHWRSKARLEEDTGDRRSQELRNAMDSTFQLTEQALGARLWAQQGGHKFGLDPLVLHLAISLRWDLFFFASFAQDPFLIAGVLPSCHLAQCR